MSPPLLASRGGAGTLSKIAAQCRRAEVAQALSPAAPTLVSALVWRAARATGFHPLPCAAQRPMRTHSRRQKRQVKGAIVVEYAMVYAALLLPITMMIIFTAQLLWVWHSIVDYTREGARYATTHCWQPGGANVVSYMRSNTPIMVDREQFRDGAADIQVTYYSRNRETGVLEEFACEAAECSRQCVPDIVRVRISSYEFRAFLSYLGLPPVPVPDFQTMLPIEGAGCSPDTEECVE